jgi:hypothetical protein
MHAVKLRCAGTSATWKDGICVTSGGMADWTGEAYIGGVETRTIQVREIDPLLMLAFQFFLGRPTLDDHQAHPLPFVPEGVFTEPPNYQFRQPRHRLWVIVTVENRTPRPLDAVLSTDHVGSLDELLAA